MRPPTTASGAHRRWLWACLALVALVSSILMLLRPAISYRALEIGLDVAWIGPLATSFNLLPLVITLPVGRWMDRGGQRVAALASSSLLLVAIVGFIWSNSLLALIGWSVVSGACSLVLNTTAQSLVAMRSPVESYDTRFAAVSLAGSAGQVFGGGLISLIPLARPGGGAASIFIAAAVAAAVVVVVTLSLHSSGRPGDPDAEPGSTPPKRSAGHILSTPGMVPAIAASLTVLATVDLITIYLPVLAIERGWTESAVGALLTIRAVATVVARVALGALSRRLGARRLLIISVFASAVGLAVAALPLSLAWSAVMLGLVGLTLGFGQPLSMVLVAHAAPLGSQGTALSLRMSGNMLGLAVLPALVAPLVGLFGAGAGLLAASAALGGVTGMLAATRAR